MKDETDRLPNNPSRRRLLTAAGAVLVGGSIGVMFNPTDNDDPQPEAKATPEETAFNYEVAGYAVLANLAPNQIIFYDREHRAVGEPVDFTSALPPEHLVNGVAVSPPSLEWRRAAAARLLADPRHKGREIVRSRNVALLFRSALAYQDEPELVQGIISGEINSQLDIINYFGRKPVLGLPSEVSRARYVGDDFRLAGRIPELVGDIIESELRQVIPGLCAQESKFHNGLRSSVGARGIFQFMPHIWRAYGQSERAMLSLKTQLEVAGRLMGDIYRELMHHAEATSLEMVRDRFANDEEYNRQFVVPLMINSYNAGSARLATAVNTFFDNKRNLEGLEGRDIFIAMADFAEASTEGRLAAYGPHAREYVPRCYALSQLVDRD